MNAGVTSGAPDWREDVAEALRGAAVDWTFVAKTAFALLLTGWLAMRFQLEQPASAMITVGIVSHPHSGMVVAKSFYRALGTLAGCLAALLLVALFPQQRVLFLGTLALWIGLCAGGAALHRNFRSYGFVLAGYTAAIVAIPVIGRPDAVFDSAVMRVSEVMLGLFVAGLVSDVLFPQRLGRVLRTEVRGQFAGFLGFVRDSLGGVLDRGTLQAAHLRFVRQTVQIENQRSSVVFEDAGARVRSPRLRRFNQRFMAVSTTYQSLHHLMNRLQGADHAAARAALTTLFATVAQALDAAGCTPRRAAEAVGLERAMAVLRADMPTQIVAARTPLRGRDALLDFDTGAELLRRFVAELHAWTEAYATLAEHRPMPVADHEAAPFHHENDRVGAVLTTARTFAVMATTAAFWIASAWSSGASAMLIATIFCGLMASAPDPLRAVRAMLLGYVAGIVAAFVCSFGVLVRMDGFALMAAGVLPFLLPGLYLYTRPALAGMGTGYVIAFVYMTALKNPMSYDAAHFLNDALSQVVGIGGTALAFMLVPNASGNRWLRERLVRKLRLQVARACHAPLPGLRARFEAASRDLLIQVANQTGAGTAASRSLLAWGLSVQETGRAAIELRAEQAALDAAAVAGIDRVVRGLAAFYDRPDASGYGRVRAAVTAAIDAGGLPRAARAHLHLIRLALLDRDSVLAPFMPAPALPEGTVHAA